MSKLNIQTFSSREQITAVQYDGTNAQEIVDWVDNNRYIQNDNGKLIFEDDDGYITPISKGDYVTKESIGWYSKEFFENKYFVLDLNSGIALISKEREEQISKHGYDGNHDSFHKSGEMAKTAATLAVMHTEAEVRCPDDEWGSGNNPWFLEDKLKDNLIKRLTVAGALIAAEIDRLNRS